MFLFSKNEDTLKKELFTYFTPTPPVRNRGYREKELDSVAQLFNEFNISFEIQSTVPAKTGFWTIFKIWGAEKDMSLLKSSDQYIEFQLAPSIDYQNSNSDDQLELISESDEQFENMDNFKI